MSKNGLCTIDAVIFMAVSWYLHYYDMCLLGFCYLHRQYQRHHQHRMSVASFLFFTVAAFVASFFSWWPKKLGAPPYGLFNIIYKAWVGVLLYNFTERLIWFALYEMASYFLEYMFNTLEWVTQVLHLNEYFKDYFNILKGDVAHQVLLAIISLYALYTFVILKGCLAIIDDIKRFVRDHVCNQENNCKMPSTPPKSKGCPLTVENYIDFDDDENHMYT